MIWLYRRPILDTGPSTTRPLGAIITHVLVHETATFGLSDDDMETIEQTADETLRARRSATSGLPCALALTSTSCVTNRTIPSDPI